MALTDSLQAYWKFDESSGDASSQVNSNTLTNVNTVTYVAAKINNGADLESGSSQYLTITNAAQTGLAFTTSFSIAGWFKLESAPATDIRFGLMSKGSLHAVGAARYSWQIQDDGGTDYLLLYLDSGGSTSNLRVAWTHSTGTFIHLAVTYNLAGGTAKFYVDGSQQGADQTGGVTSLSSETGDVFVGAYNLNGTKVSYYDGVMDECGMWSRELSGSEISQLYNAGAGLTYPFASAVNSNFLSFM